VSGSAKSDVRIRFVLVAGTNLSPRRLTGADKYECRAEIKDVSLTGYNSRLDSLGVRREQHYEEAMRCHRESRRTAVWVFPKIFLHSPLDV
jgi:hypothetical protein